MTLRKSTTTAIHSIANALLLIIRSCDDENGTVALPQYIQARTHLLLLAFPSSLTRAARLSAVVHQLTPSSLSGNTVYTS